VKFPGGPHLCTGGEFKSVDLEDLSSLTKQWTIFFSGGLGYFQNLNACTAKRPSNIASYYPGLILMLKTFFAQVSAHQKTVIAGSIIFNFLC